MRLRAQTAAPVKIGVLTDAGGPYADSGGVGSRLAAEMAVSDFGGVALGAPVRVVMGDTQNKPDVAAALARTWFDSDGVDAVTDLPVTPVALAVLQVAKEKTRTVMITASAINEFTSKLCTPVSTHWADDVHAMTTGTARQVVAGGGKSWFFVTVDFTFGKALEAAATQVIEGAGGKVLGHAYFPIGNTDFSAQLVTAQSSGAQVIGLAAVGNDQVNAIKQASEFGLTRGNGKTLAGFLVYITDIHALGLPMAQGLTLSSGFYWDQTEASRAFARRFFAERKAMPTRNQASVYLATLHFLKAMAQAGTRDPLAVGKAMRALPVDYFGRPASVRADGRVLYDVTLYRVKAPGESRAPWDYYAPLATLPAAEAFLPMNPACA
ncbi:MAG: ABC transporter substrate-binding protein [Proteobacteria bacterium]|nr:ABC transporter substrate-binding protein [Pseudomonadota bacterium]